MAAVVDRVARLRAVARFLDPEVAREQIQEMAESTRDRTDLLEVIDGDDVVGLVWLAGEGSGELLVWALDLDDPARAPDLVPVLVGRARAVGARMVGVGIHPGDP